MGINKITRRGLISGAAATTAALFAKKSNASTQNLEEHYKQDGVNLLTRTWSNWAGNITSKPKKIYRPKNLTELQNIVKQSNKIRVIGSSHSFNPGAKTNETLIMTDKLNRILNRNRNCVKVESGVKLHDLNKDLWTMGLAFPSLGDIDKQSVAGLLSTATHGTGLQWGTVSNGATVKAVELVLANGELLSLSRDNPADQQYLEAARVSMGLLGVVYSVTFELAPAHNLHMQTKVVDLAEAMMPEHYLNHDHYEFFLFPYTGKAQQVFRNITTNPPTKKRKVFTWFDEIIVNNVVLDAILKMNVLTPSKLPKVMAFLVSQLSDSDQVERSYEAMTAVRNVKFVESEFSLPIDKMPEAVAIYNQLVYEFSQEDHPDRFFCSFPFEVRFTGPDSDTMLSPAQGRTNCYVSVNLHKSYDGYTPFLKEFNKRIDAIGGRPHWGKLFYQNPSHHYSRFNEFLAIKNELDAQGKFSNKFWKDYLL